MPPHNDSDKAPGNQVQQRTLQLLLIGVTLAFGWILLPFYGTIMWGAIIALLFTPLYRRLLPHLKYRRTWAALLTLLVVLVVVVLPFALVTASMAREAAGVYKHIDSGDWKPAQYLRGAFDALPTEVTALLDRFGFNNFDDLQVQLVSSLKQASQLIGKQALGIGLNTFDFVVSLFITLYLAFFLIRDGSGLVRALRDVLPLAPAHKLELGDKFVTVVRATVKGNLLVAAIQGMLGGFAFWFLGVGGALLWAVLMAFLSLLPAVGAGLVWMPVALFFLVSGAVWKGLALIGWGVLVIGLIDNLLRPMLVGKDTRMPDYLVMITTLGGMAVFGINGFVLGPAIAAMFIATWQIFGAKND